MACRFSSFSAEDTEALIARAENENTSKATAVWLRTVTEFSKAKKLDIVRNMFCGRVQRVSLPVLYKDETSET